MTGQAQILGSGTSQINTNAFKSTGVFASPSFDFGSSSFNGFGFGGGVPPVIFGGFGFQDYSPTPRKTGGRKYRRTPSLISIELGLKSSRQSPGEFTGIVSRPILVSKRRKR